MPEVGKKSYQGKSLKSVYLANCVPYTILQEYILLM